MATCEHNVPLDNICDACELGLIPGKKSPVIPSAGLNCCNADRSSVGEKKHCIWTEDYEGNWWTDCDGHWILNAGTPKENDMNFCPICGKRLRQIERSGRNDDLRNTMP